MFSKKKHNGIFHKVKVRLVRKYLRTMLYFGLIKKVNLHHRGVGKTTMMIEEAEKKGAAIIVGTYADKRLIEDRCRERGIKVYVFSPFYVSNLEGLKFPNGVYIDESVKPKALKIIQRSFRIKILGGFQRQERSD